MKRSLFIAEGTVFKSDGIMMLHNKELSKDCYKVSIDKSLVDATCIPAVANNDFKTVKESESGFIAWPKDQFVFESYICVLSTYIYTYMYIILHISFNVC